MEKPKLKVLRWNPYLKDKAILKVERGVFISIDKDSVIYTNTHIDRNCKGNKIKLDRKYCAIKKKGCVFSPNLRLQYENKHLEVQQDLAKIKRYFEIKKVTITCHKQIIELGYEAEDLMNWRKSTISINREIDCILKQMKEWNIPFDESYSYVDENGQKRDMEYALQFLEVRK